MNLIKWEKPDTITLLTSSFLPFTFSSVLVLFGFAAKSFINIRDKLKAQTEQLNQIIDDYNLVIIRTIKRYNILMNNYFYMARIKERLEKIPQIKNIIEYWEIKTIEMIELSANPEFRIFIII